MLMVVVVVVAVVLLLLLRCIDVCAARSWNKPAGNAAWLIDIMPFPHIRVSTTNITAGAR
jgi:hypothetical protein